MTSRATDYDVITASQIASNSSLYILFQFEHHKSYLNSVLFYVSEKETKISITPRIYTIVRNNFDCTKNESGKLLAQLCVESGLRILNGRTFGDSLGFYTCFHDNGGVSSFDCILPPEHLFYQIRCFNIQPPNEFSDLCPIWMGLMCRVTATEQSVSIYSQ